MVCDIQYKNGIDRIEATYEAFINGSSNVERVIMRFSHYAMEFQTEFYQHMKTEKITKFLKIVMEKDGADACRAMCQYILVVKSKYLQIMVMYFIYQNEPDTVAKEFEKFNRDFYDFQSNFEKIVRESKVPGAWDQPNTVHNFLEACGLIKYEENFQAQNVRIEDLLDMDDSEMQEIGVKNYRDRKILKKAIQDHRAQGPGSPGADVTSLSRDMATNSIGMSNVAGSAEIQPLDPGPRSLGEGWEERQDANGRTYYLNLVSMTSQWQHPAQIQPMDPGPSSSGAGWEERQDDNGRTYYETHVARTSQWQHPGTYFKIYYQHMEVPKQKPNYSSNSTHRPRTQKLSSRCGSSVKRDGRGYRSVRTQKNRIEGDSSV